MSESLQGPLYFVNSIALYRVPFLEFLKVLEFHTTFIAFAQCGYFLLDVLENGQFTLPDCLLLAHHSNLLRPAHCTIGDSTTGNVLGLPTFSGYVEDL